MATAPITDTDTRNDYTATASQTTFAYTFWIKDEAHLDVYVDGVLQTITTDYTVSAVQSVTGANVVFNSGLTSGQAVAIVYNPDVERATEFQTSGAFKASSLNLELTYLTSISQWLKTQVNRALVWADSVDITNFSFTLADPSGNAGKALVVNSSEDGIEYSAIASTTLVGNFETLVTDGDGSTDTFALGFTPIDVNSIYVSVDDAVLEPTAEFTVSGTNITFATPPATGTNNIYVKNLASGVAASTPSNDSVTTAKIQDGAVTAAKLATGDTVLKDSIDDDLINTYTDTTIAVADEVLFGDASDSNNMKKDTVQGILDLVPTDLYGKTGATVAAGDTFVLWDASDSNSIKTDTVQGILDLVPSSTTITLGTEQATTSGTAIDFTSIPSGTKRITINLDGVSTSGTDNWLIQLGDSGGVEATGYVSVGSNVDGASTGSTGYTAGIGIRSGAADVVAYGSVILTLEDSTNNTWCAAGTLNSDSTYDNTFVTSGRKALSAELDRVRLTTTGGTDTFDAGAVNITYE